MCSIHAFEKSKFKDLQPPEKSGLQYKCLVLMLKIVYECIVSNETSLKQFSLEKKSYSPHCGYDSFYYTANLQFFGMKKCHMSQAPFVTNGSKRLYVSIRHIFVRI